MPKIIPIRDLKDTSSISNMVNESSEPVYVTKNGYEDMVILSADEYGKIVKNYSDVVAEKEKLAAANEIITKLMEAERDFAEGRYRSHGDVMEDLRKKYDFQD